MVSVRELVKVFALFYYQKWVNRCDWVCNCVYVGCHGCHIYGVFCLMTVLHQPLSV